MLDYDTLREIRSIHLTLEIFIAVFSVGLAVWWIARLLQLYFLREYKFEATIIRKEPIHKLDSKQVTLLDSSCHDFIKAQIRLFKWHLREESRLNLQIVWITCIHLAFVNRKVFSSERAHRKLILNWFGRPWVAYVAYFEREARVGRAFDAFATRFCDRDCFDLTRGVLGSLAR